MGIEDRDYYRDKHNSRSNLRRSEDFRKNKGHYSYRTTKNITPKPRRRIKSKLKYKLKKGFRSLKSLLSNPIVLIIVAVLFFSYIDDYNINFNLNERDFGITEKGYDTVLLDFVGAGDSLYLVNYDNATDPTYDELLRFIMKDKTDTILYNDKLFVCADYAVAVHNNAEKTGIRAGVVDVTFAGLSDGHALNCFNTTDKGLIFIDCTGNPYNINKNNCDTKVNLETGEAYIPRPLFSSGIYYEPLGTVRDYKIHW